MQNSNYLVLSEASKATALDLLLLTSLKIITKEEKILGNVEGKKQNDQHQLFLYFSFLIKLKRRKLPN